MPTYTVTAPAGRLSTAQQEQIASEITRVHKEATGAQSFFAQVIFNAVQPGQWFLGGKPLQGNDQIFIHGQVRSGRPPEVKRRLLENLMKNVGQIAKCPANRVWVYIIEVPPSMMGEYGHILPEPGTEAAWLEALPQADRDLMTSIGL